MSKKHETPLQILEALHQLSAPFFHAEDWQALVRAVTVGQILLEPRTDHWEYEFDQQVNGLVEVLEYAENEINDFDMNHIENHVEMHGAKGIRDRLSNAVEALRSLPQPEPADG